MAGNLLVDAGFLVVLLSRRDSHHPWAVTQATQHAPPWRTCEAVPSEAFHLLGARGTPGLSALLQPRAVLAPMTETLSDPLVLVTDSDFRIYRRHSRQIIPCVTPY